MQGWSGVSHLTSGSFTAQGAPNSKRGSFSPYYGSQAYAGTLTAELENRQIQLRDFEETLLEYDLADSADYWCGLQATVVRTACSTGCSASALLVSAESHKLRPLSLNYLAAGLTTPRTYGGLSITVAGLGQQAASGRQLQV